MKFPNFRHQLLLVGMMMIILSILSTLLLIDSYVQVSELETHWLVTISVFSITSTLLLIVYFVQRELKPLKELEIATKAMAKGSFSHIQHQSNHHGISHSINAFNKVVSHVQLAQMEQLETYKSLLEEKEFSEFILESIVNSVITMDLNGTVTHLNPMASSLAITGLHSNSDDSLLTLFPFFSDETCRNPLHFFLSDHTLNPEINKVGTTFLLRVDQEITVFEYTFSVMTSHQQTTIGFVLVLRDVTEELELRRKLAYQASHDALTGLINRFEFERQLTQLLNEQTDNHPMHCLIYMDLDRFKLVNDTSGHLAGDELLRQISFLIRKIVPDNHLVARIGGDEFILLLNNMGEKEAQPLLEQVRDAIKNHQFLWENNAFSIGISMGCIEIHRHHPLSTLITQADAACYQAKNQGGNIIEWYKPNLPEIQKHQGAILWVPKIQQAIKEDNFRLFLQPIKPMGRHPLEKNHYEVLIRHQGKESNVISPDVFLPSAERYNLMREIDRWVVIHMFEWLKGQATCYENTHFSINLSGQSLSDPDFLDFILAQFETTQVPPACLCFEITETAMVSNLSHAQKLIDTLSKTGCQFALDDFGTGLSSFAYIKNFPVQYLKIDGIFIQNILNSHLDQTIVKSIIEISHCLGMQTIAEYVETTEIKDYLQQLGIDMGQGWALGKPFPIDQFKSNHAPSVV